MALIYFFFGFGQFFVAKEPSLAELSFVPLLMVTPYHVYLERKFLILLATSAWALLLEYVWFNTVMWSLISIYLCLMYIVVRWHCEYSFKVFISSLCFGAAAGCMLSLSLIPVLGGELYMSGIRFKGFFKDPNVTAPTAAYFALLSLFLTKKRYFLWFFPGAVFLIALSRATALAVLFVGILYIAARNAAYAIFFICLVSILVFIDPNLIIRPIDGLIGLMGRGAFLNYYDFDRASNWLKLFEIWADSPIPLGPSFSDRWDFSTHSSVLRLLYEQGVVVLLVYGFLLAGPMFRGAHPALLYPYLMLVVNGFVVDATHWRILFIALGIVYAGTALESSRKQERALN